MLFVQFLLDRDLSGDNMISAIIVTNGMPVVPERSEMNLGPAGFMI